MRVLASLRRHTLFLTGLIWTTAFTLPLVRDAQRGDMSVDLWWAFFGCAQVIAAAFAGAVADKLRGWGELCLMPPERQGWAWGWNLGGWAGLAAFCPYTVLLTAFYFADGVVPVTVRAAPESWVPRWGGLAVELGMFSAVAAAACIVLAAIVGGAAGLFAGSIGGRVARGGRRRRVAA